MFDVNINKLRELDAVFGGRVQTRYSSALELEEAVKQADLVIGAVLLPGAKAPTLVSNSLVAHMKPGAVLVDIAIDQGGCFEDSRPTTHDDPTFAVHDTLFYCVANMPARRAQDVDVRADQRHHAVCASNSPTTAGRPPARSNPALAKGLSTHEGALFCRTGGR